MNKIIFRNRASETILITWYDEENDLLTQDIKDKTGLGDTVTVGAKENLTFEYKNHYSGEWKTISAGQNTPTEFLAVIPLENLNVTEIRAYKMVDGERVDSNILKYNKTIDKNIKIYWVYAQQLRVGDVGDKTGTDSTVIVGSERPLYYEYKNPDSNEWIPIGGMRQYDSRDLRERATIPTKVGLNEIRAFALDENTNRVYSNILKFTRTEAEEIKYPLNIYTVEDTPTGGSVGDTSGGGGGTIATYIYPKDINIKTLAKVPDNYWFDISAASGNRPQFIIRGTGHEDLPESQGFHINDVFNKKVRVSTGTVNFYSYIKGTKNFTINIYNENKVKVNTINFNWTMDVLTNNDTTINWNV